MSKERGTPIDPNLLAAGHIARVFGEARRLSATSRRTLEDAELEVQMLFTRIAACFGEEAACGLFKKYSKPTRSKHRRDTDLLLLFYMMENPRKLTLAKQIDPKNPQRILAQLKRALRDSRYARFRKGAATVNQRSASAQDVLDKWHGLFDLRFPGRR